jgi:CubicO group peptidase (beta-lactamase class C family)
MDSRIQRLCSSSIQSQLIVMLIFSAVFCLSGCTSSGTSALGGKICRGDSCLTLQSLSTKLQQDLDGKCNKYAFVLYHGLAHVSHAAGKRRTSADPPEQDFTEDYRYNPASVTKVITGVGVLQLLAKKGISIEEKIWKYLPADWQIDNSFKQISFRQLLSHHSGITEAKDVFWGTYDAIKTTMEQGITLSDTAFRAYANENYAICRILIAYLDGYDPHSTTDQGKGTSDRYIQVLQRNIFDKLQIQNVSCTPASVATLFYPFPAGTAKGDDWGDWELVAGPAGVQLSANELATFLVQLRLTTTLLSDSMKTVMDKFNLGWDLPITVDNGTVNVQLKGGLLGGSPGARLSTGMLDFDNGLQMTVVIDGPPDAISVPIDAYNHAWVKNSTP